MGSRRVRYLDFDACRIKGENKMIILDIVLWTIAIWFVGWMIAFALVGFIVAMGVGGVSYTTWYRDP